MAAVNLKVVWIEMRRRKLVRVAVVYAVAAWVVVEAASVIFPGLLLPEWTSRLVLALALIGFPIALALAWAFEVPSDGLRREPAGPPAAAPGEDPTASRPSERRLQESGTMYRDWLEHDPDFDDLRADPRFISILDRLPSASAH